MKRVRERLEKIVALAERVLAQGTSPGKLAFTIALGVAIGILPIVWGSTLLCVLLAYLFRLDQKAIQAANYLAYPLQVALFIPLYRIGATMFPSEPSASVAGTARKFKLDYRGDIPLLLGATFKALAAWLIIAPPVAILLYFLLLPLITRIRLRTRIHHKRNCVVCRITVNDSPFSTEVKLVFKL